MVQECSPTPAGGTDIDGVDTLRGLVDYRLRAPNRILFQAEFYHNIQGPIGIYGFYDTGKVALTAGDLSFAHLRHDVGVGVYFKVENKICDPRLYWLRSWRRFASELQTAQRIMMPTAHSRSAWTTPDR
jgi:hypothetical protein